MQGSWSESESGVTMEIGLASSGAFARPAAARLGTDFGGHSDSQERRYVIPRVQLEFNRSDQLVPVYWDQTVPVWSSNEARTSSKRKPSQASRSTANRPTSTAHVKRSPEIAASGEGFELGAVRASSNVSFDAIMSIYQSSIVERSRKWSRVLGTILKRRSKKSQNERYRLRRNFTERFSELKLGDINEESLRSLQEAIDQTNVLDHSTICNLHSGTLIFLRSDAIF
uniref:Uncharacterized protein n=1 Tax=Physcomitrium patens TaxID=3218 RepID=A0A2K1IME8_PHYPA|nr:hypothetical protein PHYPA_026771 [Physcomitrium patens]